MEEIMQDRNEPNDLKKTSTSKKESIEMAVLELQLKELRRKWWSKPTYIAATSPFVLAFIGLIIGFQTEFFSHERLKNKKLLHTQQQKLKANYVLLEEQKNKLSKASSELNTVAIELERSKQDFEEAKDLVLKISNDGPHPPGSITIQVTKDEAYEIEKSLQY